MPAICEVIAALHNCLTAARFAKPIYISVGAFDKVWIYSGYGFNDITIENPSSATTFLADTNNDANHPCIVSRIVRPFEGSVCKENL